MRRVSILLVMAINLTSSIPADEPDQPYQIVAPKPNGIIATGINGHGEVIGFEWVEEEDHPGVVAQVPFYAKGEEITYLPILEGYTATFPEAVSDNGLVVGRASKPAPPGVQVAMRNQGFVWDAENGIRGLGVLEGDSASFASGITSDGSRISGFSVGPNRVRACVWDHDGDDWNGTALPHEFMLGSNVVPISNDGNFVAAVDGVLPCLWSRDDSEEWTREVIADEAALIPRAVNNSGMVVGLRHTGDGHTHAVIWTRDEGHQQLEKPEGYLRSEASAVNNQGVVVGVIDGPFGSEIGPNAFVYEKGQLRILDEGGPGFTAATAINDQGQIAGVLEMEEE